MIYGAIIEQACAALAGHARRLDLCGADLGGANLDGANLGGVDLRDADLGGAYLDGADLGGADLRRAYLRGAYLGGADLRGANLRGANLRDANLRGANLRDANLGGAYLGGADLGGANLGGANLGGAIGFRFAGAPDPAALRAAVAARIEAHPEMHDQSQWGDGDPECGTPCCVAGWACRLGGGTRGASVENAATRLLWLDGAPMPNFTPDASRDAILSVLRAVPS